MAIKKIACRVLISIHKTPHYKFGKFNILWVCLVFFFFNLIFFFFFAAVEIQEEEEAEAGESNLERFFLVFKFCFFKADKLCKARHCRSTANVLFFKLS